MSADRLSVLKRIRSNIERSGYHIHVVAGGPVPRFCYTIGISTLSNYELVFAGGGFFGTGEVKHILDSVVSQGETGLSDGRAIEVAPWGAFSLTRAHETWVHHLVLGALDYFGRSEMPVLQVLPSQAHWTCDVPILSKPRDSAAEPAWMWVTEPWNYDVPKTSMAVTNLGALRAELVTEVVRWEEDEWEMFAGAGPDVPREEIRRVPLGTLLAIDPSLKSATELEIGKGLWREQGDVAWHAWGN